MAMDSKWNRPEERKVTHVNVAIASMNVKQLQDSTVRCCRTLTGTSLSSLLYFSSIINAMAKHAELANRAKNRPVSFLLLDTTN